MRGLLFVLMTVMCGSACPGKLGLQDPETVLPDPPAQRDPVNDADPTTRNNETVPDDLFPEMPCEGVACDDPVPSVLPRLTRLTHHQWENATRDLLRLPERPGNSVAFLRDTLSESRFDRLAENLTVTPGLWDDYREAAELLADQVSRDPSALAAIEGPDVAPDLAARNRAFAQSFGRRAYRRPLSTEEVDGYVAVMDQAGELFGSPAFERRAEVAIRAFLQSPHFLYRVETHDEPAASVVALSSLERASKLSFALWNTMPDDELLDAAERGELSDPDLLVAQVRRMLDDPRANDVITDFHGQWLDFEHFSDMTKAPELFASFTAETPLKMQHELELFIRDVVMDSNGTYRQLMTAQHTFVDAELADIYGVAAPRTDFARSDLDASRPGLLTRSGFLAVNATAYDPNPIHRGVFIDRHVLCLTVPDPPDDFTIPNGVAGNTNRERIENATSTCGGGCHTSLINPPGFAFENYDALGAWRDQDGGFPVDASGSLFFDGEDKTWRSAAELVDLIADSPSAHACYARNWFEYINGRAPTAGDEPLIARVAQASRADASIKNLLLAMVTSPVFLHRDTGRSQ